MRFRFELKKNSSILESGEFDSRSLQSAKATASKLVGGVSGSWSEVIGKSNVWTKSRNVYYDIPRLYLELVTKVS